MSHTLIYQNITFLQSKACPYNAQPADIILGSISHQEM